MVRRDGAMFSMMLTSRVIDQGSKLSRYGCIKNDDVLAFQLVTHRMQTVGLQRAPHGAGTSKAKSPHVAPGHDDVNETTTVEVRHLR